MKRSAPLKWKRTYLVQMNSEGSPSLNKNDWILIERGIAEKMEALARKRNQPYGELVKELLMKSLAKVNGAIVKN